MVGNRVRKTNKSKKQKDEKKPSGRSDLKDFGMFIPIKEPNPIYSQIELTPEQKEKQLLYKRLFEETGQITCSPSEQFETKGSDEPTETIVWIPKKDVEAWKNLFNALYERDKKQSQ